MAKFKVGDRVRRINDSCGHDTGRICSGYVGIVTEVHGSYLSVDNYTFADGQNTVPFHESYFELVEKAKECTGVTKFKCENKFSVGDVVECIEESFAGRAEVYPKFRYTILDISSYGLLKFKEVRGWWSTRHFKLAEAAKERERMAKFRVGDRVKRISADCRIHDTGILEVGDVGTVTAIDGGYLSIDGFTAHKGAEATPFHESNFELVEAAKEEKDMKNFDMKKNPWFIRVENGEQYNIANQWLKEHYGSRCHSPYSSSMAALTNTNDDGDIEVYYIMWADEDALTTTERHEIKFNFKTIIDSVEFPEVETEQEKRIRKLKETIEQAQKQIEEIQKEMK